MTLPDRASRGPPRDAGCIRSLAETDAAEYLGGQRKLSVEGGGLYRLLVDSVRDYAIFALDSAGNVLSWNAGAERLKGYAPEEIIGRHFSLFYPPDAVLAGKPEWELETAGREGSVEDEGWRIHKDGSRFWANVIITALRDDAGGLVGFAKVTRDLTERRRAEEELRVSEERFRLLVEGVKDYAIFMLETDGRVGSWNAGAERLKGYTPDEIIGRHFSVFYPLEETAAGKPEWELEIAAREGKYEEEGWRIRKDGSRFWASVLITALRGRKGALVDAVLPIVQPLAIAKALTIVHGPCADDLVARTDRAKAEKVVLNLLRNAVKFTPAGGRITLTCGRAGKPVVVTVADTGPGIAEDQHGAIFAPFVQLGRSLTSGHEGTGLGLAISRDLVRAMGGDLTVESTPGEGATFTLSLPGA